MIRFRQYSYREAAVVATMEAAEELLDFLGFHCQPQSHEQYHKESGVIGGDDFRSYAEYFPEILAALPSDLRNTATENGWFDQPGDTDEYVYDENLDDEVRVYDRWYDEVQWFLYTNGIRWIFVSMSKFLSVYGEYCYAITLPDGAILTSLPDDTVPDVAWAVVYDSNKAAPGFVEVENPEYEQ